MRLTLLGTGNARQVPVYNCGCAACERARVQPEFRRGPCCALVECGEQRWLIDAGLTDLGERFAPHSLSGILLTHYHADHAQGLLHLRWGLGLKIPVHGPPDSEGLADLYKHPGILDFSEPFAALERRELGELAVTALPLAHSKLTFGYLFEGGGQRIAYLTDTLGVPQPSADWLKRQPLNLLVLDCSAPPQPDPRNHNDLPQALQIIDELKPAHAVLTHIGHNLDTWLMENPDALPKGVILGFDGQRL